MGGRSINALPGESDQMVVVERGLFCVSSWLSKDAPCRKGQWYSNSHLLGLHSLLFAIET